MTGAGPLEGTSLMSPGYSFLMLGTCSASGDQDLRTAKVRILSLNPSAGPLAGTSHHTSSGVERGLQLLVKTLGPTVGCGAGLVHDMQL
eukprot:890213-Pelagomonas_calceolata.AAC.1